MNIKEIIEELTAERDRFQRAIDALSDGEEVAPPRQTKPARLPKLTLRKQSLPCKNAAQGCTKEFTSPVWRERHEEDCAHVVKPNGSAAVGRYPN